jgi:hypothetical protein
MNRGAGLSTPLSTVDGVALRNSRATETVGKGVDNPCSSSVYAALLSAAARAAKYTASGVRSSKL